MYIWRKFVTENWLEPRNDQLQRRFGPGLAIVERPGTIRLLLEISCSNGEQARGLREQFGGQIKKLSADWFQRMAKQAWSKPLRIGSRLTVVHTVESKPNRKAETTIVIPAEAAFGTGDHATTAMCLRMLEHVTRTLPPGWSMLDAGTGSGILAIAGSRLGAGRVVAVENDPLACSVAMRNARANRVSNIEFRTGDVLKLKPAGKFDVIAANLFSEILIAALPIWSRHLSSDGSLILSGVLRAQERALVAALRRNHFDPREIRRRGKWIALRAVRAPKTS
jgi:ribosomal protein L11 methyltransferase